MKKIIQITTHEKQAEVYKKFWHLQTSEFRLNELENLRLESGKFLYEYPPTRLQRVVRVTEKK